MEAYCTKCGRVFLNIDGCPDCGTDIYLIYDFRDE
jgi:predicted  nucleic acid-binding Zn-ribbon protein